MKLVFCAFIAGITVYLLPTLCWAAAGGAGGNGTEWDTGRGAGGGGGSAGSVNGTISGGPGGSYGGGGGASAFGASAVGGSGAQGIIRITYTPNPPPGLTLSGNVKFLRSLAVIGSVAKGAGSFVIDHPLNPRNKLLYHSFVESPDVKNMYDGTATLNEKGEATINLPNYFQALNRNFRYQFFPFDEAMPNLYIKDEIKDNRFTIAGGVPGGKISWQVTGIRHDPYILAHPIRVEVNKSATTEVKKGECIFEPLCE